MKLSEAIRRGHTMIGESRDGFLNGGCGCALGAAWVGIGKTSDEYWERQREDSYRLNMVDYISQDWGIPRDVVAEISCRHFSRQMTRLQLADWVEQNYESKLPQKERETDEAYARRMVKAITAQPVEA